MKVSESRTRPYGDPTTEDTELLEWTVRNFRQVAENPEQGEINRTLLSSLQMLIEKRGWERVYAGSDTFFAWKKGDATRRVSPDIYLLDDPPPPERIPMTWSTWLPDNPPPRFAVEVVSKRWTKDYVLDPVKYEELGCKELVIFDPHATPRATHPRQRVPLTVFRRTAEGRLETVYSGKGPAWSEQLGMWLFPRPGYPSTLRLSEDETGTRILPTEAEDRKAARRFIEQQRAVIEQQDAVIGQLKAVIEQLKAGFEKLKADFEKESSRHVAERRSIERRFDLQRAELEAEQAARLEKEAALETEQAARRAETEAHEREVGALKTQLRAAQAKATTRRPRRGPNPKAGGK